MTSWRGSPAPVTRPGASPLRRATPAEPVWRPTARLRRRCPGLDLEREAVDAGVVGPEPVAKAAVRDRDRPERLLAAADRGRQGVLDVVEQGLAVGDRGRVVLAGQAGEVDLTRR